MNTIKTLGFFTLCVCVGMLLEYAGDEILLATSSWPYLILLIPIEALSSFILITRGYRSIIGL